MANDRTTPTRRTVLSAIGTGVATGLAGRALADERRAEEFLLVQGARCVPVQPVRGEKPVREFYGFRLPEKYVTDENGGLPGDGTQFESRGTTALQRPQTSIAFLYQGPERLSLVVVHGSVDADDGGSVTFRVVGLPEDGRWIVKDDRYRDPETGEIAESNYDVWAVDSPAHRIDWTWGSGGTDGGAFGGLGEQFAVAIDPAFNDAATLAGRHYEGTVTDWEFLSGTDGGNRVALDMDAPVLLATGRCDDDTDLKGKIPTERGETGRTDETDQEDERERENERDREAERGRKRRRNRETDRERSDRKSEDEDEDEDDESEVEKGTESEPADGDERPYVICHSPPGNPDRARTIEVGSEEALDAHLAHGDTRGPCSSREK